MLYSVNVLYNNGKRPQKKIEKKQTRGYARQALKNGMNLFLTSTNGKFSISCCQDREKRIV